MQPCHSRGGRSHWDPHFVGSHPYQRRSQGCAGLAPVGPCGRGQTVRVQAAGPGWPREGPRVPAQGAGAPAQGRPTGGRCCEGGTRAGAAWPSRAAVGRIKGAARARAFFPGGGAGGGADGGAPRPRFPGAGDCSRPRPAPRCTQAVLGRREEAPAALGPPGGTRPGRRRRDGVRDGKGANRPTRGFGRRSGRRAG